MAGAFATGRANGEWRTANSKLRILLTSSIRNSLLAIRLLAMPATPDDLFAYLDRLGIAHRTVSHPPLFTVEQSQALRGQIEGGHTKNLFLKDRKGALFLVTALEDAEIALKSLHRRLGASGRFSFGSAELMRETLGVEPGAVTPFAAMNDSARRVAVVLDAALMEHATINAHPLRNTMTTSIAREDLVKFLQATGHPPRIVAVAEPAGGALQTPGADTI
jgi:Ala-tRNA(Pro) deacylase